MAVSARNLRTALYLLLIGVTSPLAAQTPGELRLEPITFVAFDGTTVEAEAGTFFVHENRQKPDGAVISLAFVRLPSTSASPGPPIVFLAGGPGGSGIDSVRRGVFPIANELRAFGDVIALDQRGTGTSEPSLECKRRNDVLISADRPFDASELLEQLLANSDRCASNWRGRGVDLDGYNTRDSADDLDELRQALGADQLILWGESYGTHLAMATIRRHGAHVAKAILHGPEGPNHTVKLPRASDKTLATLARLVRNDSSVGSALPDLVGTLAALIATLDADPQTVDTVDPLSGQAVRVTFGGQDLALLFAAQIGSDEFFRSVPRLLATAERGDYTLLAQLAAALRQPIPISAMTFAMDCASGVTRRRLRKVRRQARRAVLGALPNLAFPEVCEAWNVADLGDEFRSKLSSGVRSLFVTGTLDGRTPVSNAIELRRGLRNSEHLILEGASHDRVLNADARVLALIGDFLADRPLANDRVNFLPLSFDPID